MVNAYSSFIDMRNIKASLATGYLKLSSVRQSAELACSLGWGVLNAISFRLGTSLCFENVTDCWSTAAW